MNAFCLLTCSRSFQQLHINSGLKYQSYILYTLFSQIMITHNVLRLQDVGLLPLGGEDGDQEGEGRIKPFYFRVQSERLQPPKQPPSRGVAVLSAGRVPSMHSGLRPLSLGEVDWHQSRAAQW